MANNEKTILSIILVGLIVVGAYFGYDHFLKEDVVDVDDIVQVNYIAWIKGSEAVFATTIVNEYNITKDTLLDDTHRYRPISITVGPGEASKGTIKVVEGLDEGLMGLKIGDIVEIEIPPEKGYEADPEDIIEVDRTLDTFSKTQTASLFQSVERYVGVTPGDFLTEFGKDAEVGDIVNMQSWYGTVVQATDEAVYIRSDPEIGTVVSMLPWNMEVSEVNDETIVLKFQAEIGSLYQNAYGSIRVDEITEDEIIYYQVGLVDEIETIYGMAEVIDLGENFELYIIPEEGRVISAEDGNAVIKNITETTFDLDYNPAYVGTTIVYKVKIEKIIKAEG